MPGFVLSDGEHKGSNGEQAYNTYEYIILLMKIIHHWQLFFLLAIL